MTIAWKSISPLSKKEGYAKKFQILRVTKYLKVEFHSGEAENGKCKVDHAHKAWLFSSYSRNHLSPDSCCIGKHKNMSRTCISGSVLKCETRKRRQIHRLAPQNGRKIADASILKFFRALRSYHQLVSKGVYTLIGATILFLGNPYT